MMDEKLNYLGDVYMAMARVIPENWACPTFEEFLNLAQHSKTRDPLVNFAVACTKTASFPDSPENLPEASGPPDKLA